MSEPSSSQEIDEVASDLAPSLADDGREPWRRGHLSHQEILEEIARDIAEGRLPGVE